MANLPPPSGHEYVILILRGHGQEKAGVMGLSETEFSLLMNVVQLCVLSYIAYLGKRTSNQAEVNAVKTDQVKEAVQNGNKDVHPSGG